MADHPIPDELVDHIARLGIPASERRPDALDRQRAWNMLQALAEWAAEQGATHLDLRTWQGVRAELPGERARRPARSKARILQPLFTITPVEDR